MAGDLRGVGYAVFSVCHRGSLLGYLSYHVHGVHVCVHGSECVCVCGCASVFPLVVFASVFLRVFPDIKATAVKVKRQPYFCHALAVVLYC